jgi:hypothetical protein
MNTIIQLPRRYKVLTTKKNNQLLESAKPYFKKFLNKERVTENDKTKFSELLRKLEENSDNEYKNEQNKLGTGIA